MALGWFGPKRIGTGVAPRGWPGWLVTFLLVAGVAADVRYFHPAQFGLADTYKPIVAILLAAVYLAVVALTYDPEA